MKYVIMTNHMINLITSSTTDPRLTLVIFQIYRGVNKIEINKTNLVIFQIYRGVNKIEINQIKINTYM